MKQDNLPLNEMTRSQIERINDPNTPAHVKKYLLSIRYPKYTEQDKKKGMNIPGMLYDDTPECAYAIIEAAARGGYDMSDEAYQVVCDAWMQDADNKSDFDWNYDPDAY